jgi:hypothetical protein
MQQSYSAHAGFGLGAKCFEIIAPFVVLNHSYITLQSSPEQARIAVAVCNSFFLNIYYSQKLINFIPSVLEYDNILNYFFTARGLIDAAEVFVVDLNYWGMYPAARVSIKYQNTSVRDKYQCVFYCALSTLHVSALISGHPQVICNTKFI